MLTADTPLRQAQGLYQGIVRGRRFVHNPRGRDALAVLSRRGARLLDAADGRPFGALAAALGEPLAALQQEAALLLRNGFVTTAAPCATAPPAPPRSLDVWLHVTNACNLDCPYCYIQKDGGALSEDTAQRLQAALVAAVQQDGIRQVRLRLAGGEPLLRFPLLQRFFTDTQALLAAAGARLQAAILTNGTLVPKEAPAWVRAHGVAVSVSLDGLGADQDALRPRRGGGGSFAAVQRGLDLWQQGGVDPYVLISIAASNLPGLPALTEHLLQRRLGFRYSLVRDLEGGAALLQPRGADLVRLGRAPRDRGAATLGAAALAALQRVFGACYDLIEAAMPVAPSFRLTHRFCDLSIRRPIQQACGAGQTALALSAEGRAAPCQAALHDPQAQAPLTTESLARQLPRVRAGLDIQRHLRADSECARCRFRHSCAGGCPLLLHRRDGHTAGRSPYCEVFRFVLPRVLRIAALELLLQEQASPRHDRLGAAGYFPAW